MVSRLAAGLVAAVMLASCGQQEDQPDAPRAASAPAAPASSAEHVLTAEGWGPLKVGMSKAEVQATGLMAAAPSTPPGESCELFQLAGRTDTWAMFNDGRLSRVSLEGQSPYRTDTGLRVGATEAEVRSTYGERAVVDPHAYEAPKGLYFTVWMGHNERGLRYETGANGVVNAIHGGDKSIENVEGCA